MNGKFESYQDMVARLYPEYRPKSEMATMEVTFQVTEACSLACTYCYQTHKGTRVMPFGTAKNFIDGLFEGRYKGYISEEEKPFIILDFIGGEPTLQAKLIEQILDYFVDTAIEHMSGYAEHFMASICTNGVHWFEPEVQHLINKYREKMSISVTIDGSKELHDSCRVFPDGRPSYDLAVAAAKDWMSRGGYIGSKITIAPANLDYLIDAILHMLELGYTEINANTVYEEGWTMEHARKFYVYLKEIADYFIDNGLVEDVYLSLFVETFGHPKDPEDNKTWCGGVGNAMLAIDPEGKLYPCLRYMKTSLGGEQPPLSIGDVWTGIGKAEEDAKWIKCLGCVTRRSESTDECFYCPIAEGCSECSAYNYQKNGTPNSRCTYICDMHKARMLANTYYWNRWYRKKGLGKRLKVYCPDEWALEIISEDELNMLKELSIEDY